MLSVLVYTLVTLVVAAVLFALSVYVFGRSELLPELERGRTLTRLPEGGVTGQDIRALRFGMSARGYTMLEVDWALEQAAEEIDRLRALVGEDAPDSGAAAGATAGADAARESEAPATGGRKR